jgi:phenylalanyl-tRNA synthetase beta chain
MKVSLNWLRELIELPPTVPALVDLLTLAGVEVEGVETTGCAVANVVVAQIRESVQHPNADRLSVCQVDDGSGAIRQIVCGAKNYKPGDKVPCALPGAELPGGVKIKAGKLRGVESNGMLCSPKELRLADDADGLLILPPDARIGAPISELYAGDTVLDLEITPNRADLLSVVGIAREIATLTGAPFANPQSSIRNPQLSSTAEIAIEDATLCPFYTARTIRGVKVAPSPEWLRRKLETVGLRPINNVVDVTNFVMLELGQPLHAFDADKLDGALQVRSAREGEEFLALGGKTCKLAQNQLVIADQRRAVAIAGVMGGEDTGVTDNTVNIVIESARFQPQSIRRTSRALGLSSDSSYRFERGIDPEGVLRASERAVQLMAEIAGVAVENVAQASCLWGGQASRLPEFSGAPTGPAAKSPVPLRPSRVAALLGIEVGEDRIETILTGFGLTKSATGWIVPSFRPDLTREVDLVEEVARVTGMEAIPARTRARFVAASGSDKAFDRAMSLRRAFTAQGLHEARSITLVPAEPRGLAFTRTPAASLQRVKNPMNDEQVVLRPNLLHGLLSAVTTNLRGGAPGVRLFEIGRVFSTQRPEEFPHAAVVLSGPVSDRNWRAGEGRAVDIFDIKGLLTNTLGATFKADKNPALALSVIVEANGRPVGFAGQLWPADARALDAAAPVVFAEIDLGALDKAVGADAARKYREIPRFPATTRDIAMLAPLALTHESIASALAKANEPLLAGVELFDVFSDPTGGKVPADRKSLAYSLTYRSPERTLTTEEVNAAHAKVKERLKAELGVALRE